ncbi:MAG: hypothetical protein AB9869_20725 [Verrucomicrobiia bacterium]
MTTKSKSVGPARMSGSLFEAKHADRGKDVSSAQTFERTRRRVRNATAMKHALLYILILTALATAAQAADQFVQVTNPGWTNSTQFSSAGAWGDYDSDGFVDLFVANASFDGEPWPLAELSLPQQRGRHVHP